VQKAYSRRREDISEDERRVLLGQTADSVAR
jgi:GST-like protein